MWYLVSFGVLLVGFSIGLYVLMSRDIYDRLDKSLSNVARTASSIVKDEIRENKGDSAAGATEALTNLKLPDVYLVFLQNDQILATNYPKDRRVAIPADALIKTARGLNGDQLAYFSVESHEGHGLRVAMLPSEIDGQIVVTAAVQPLFDTVEQLEFLRRTFYVGMTIALLIAGFGGFLLARKSLAPVVAMSDQASHMGMQNLHERLKVANENDELGRLAIVFNQLLGRLDDAFESMRKLTADASHELRTPLAIIRGEAEVALSKKRDETEYRDSLMVIQDEAKRLSHIVDDLMALSSANAERDLKLEEFYLNDLVEECCRSMQVIANTKGIVLQCESHPDISFKGDEELMRRMIMNLLDNAIKYNTAAGKVVVRLESENGHAKIMVADTGIGIPAEAATHIFDRFYRVDQSRTRTAGGTGLGLAISKLIAEAHHGNISLTSQPGNGSTFTVSLPL
jgi:heavy metal sensor kinase